MEILVCHSIKVSAFYATFQEKDSISNARPITRKSRSLGHSEGPAYWVPMYRDRVVKGLSPKWSMEKQVSYGLTWATVLCFVA